MKTFRKELEKNLHIQKMIVFGSRTRGDHLVDSDFDVIVVSKDFKGVKFVERPVALYQYWPYDEALELLCYTPEEFERKVNQIGTVQIAAREGFEVAAEESTASKRF
ncbi:nucleotidyltransferase domain-containing protein [candidate division KSB1 bacterium]|nr:nucleotidyltransferase domain-containing protein [candidate division KSB1 bacterium]NIR68981.1 nucleotidyltransferase domain-containing protein [candidate division KSB1 bacterium]NIS22603.1 nucleotidyltransferase domain-containing protein [candidate division KSB1 bacterium]NIT69463.1 nucleotidyltransferase domain-containing protein [candidate division KSB1 bacterium]NIU23118.1 nucleotidyltransferase domain-containing protein [candidate division KSB1 bacterium]